MPPISNASTMDQFIKKFNNGDWFWNEQDDPVRISVFKEYLFPNFRKAILHPYPPGLTAEGPLPDNEYLPDFVTFWNSIPQGTSEEEIKKRYTALQNAFILALDRSMNYSSLNETERENLERALNVFDNKSPLKIWTTDFDEPSDYQYLTAEGLRTTKYGRKAAELYIAFVINLGGFTPSWFSFDETDVKNNADKIAEQVAAGNLDAARAAAGGQAGLMLGSEPIGEKLLEELEVQEQNQCLIMGMLYDPFSFINQQASTINQPMVGGGMLPSYEAFATSGGSKAPYHGRIISVEPRNPDMHVNYFVSDGRAKDFFSSIDENTLEENSMFKQLYFIYEMDGTVYEIPFPLSNYDMDLAAANKVSSLRAKGASQQEIRNASIGREGTVEGDIYNLEKINIEYNGTNPSTARNDVTVNISFTLGNFSALNVTRVEYPDPNNPTKTKQLSLKDLIIAPLTDDGSTSGIGALKSNYSPKHNRVRLKVFPSGRNDPNNRKNFIGNLPIVLDLTTIDHEISRDSNDGQVSLTIKYRGFMQALMNMPYADALITKEGRKSREDRKNNINTIVGENCKPSTLRELMRIERASFEAESKDAFGDILKRMFEKKAIHRVTFNPTAVGETELIPARAKVLSDLPKYGKKTDFYTVVAWVGNAETVTWSAFTNLAEAVNNTEQEFNPTAPNKGSYFFLFGDLLNSIIDNLYQSDSAEMAKDLKSVKLKFMSFPFRIPDPSSNEGFVTISPSKIPIDLHFFAEWFHSSIVKKGLKIYPVGPFSRDLLERMLNNLLYEACISHLLPDEKPPMLRQGFFQSKTDHTQTPLYTDGTYSFFDNPNKPYFTFKGDQISKDYVSSQVESYDYVVFYQQRPPFMRELRHNDTGRPLYENEYIPTIVSGIYTKEFSYADGVSFSKNTAPFLREARYFNNSFGPLSLMNNVYDLKFELSKKMANCYFIPGIIFNFILADFEPPGIGDNTIDSTNYLGTNNDPHFRNGNEVTLSNVLGFGGYYITKKVTYELGPHPSIFKIIIDSKFLGTEADTITKKGTTIESIETDKQKCFEAYNEAVRIYENLPNTQSGSFSYAIDSGGVGTRPGRGPARIRENQPTTSLQIPSGGTVGPSTNRQVPDDVIIQITDDIRNGLLIVNDEGNFSKEIGGKNYSGQIDVNSLEILSIGENN